MSENVIQTSFSAGELSPNLFARVDFAKYRSGAATMRNFFVDYRSGASTRPGTEFIRPSTSNKPRLVKFQQSVDVTYCLEFGDHYIRFTTQGSTVVETAFPISAVGIGAVGTITVLGASYNSEDLVFISGLVSPPQLANRYVKVFAVGGSTYNIVDPLTGLNINTSAWPVYTGAGYAERVFTLPSPYAEADLPRLKFSQNAAVMNITHPLYPPYTLQLISATNWLLTPDTIGPTVAAPTGITVTSSNTGSAYYKYTVTAVDDNGQEGPPGVVTVVSGVADLRSTAGSNQISWSPVAGAASYNIYGSTASLIALGADVGGLGFIGSVPNTANTIFVDSNIAADFSQTPPVHDNPFLTAFPQVSGYFQQRLVFANGSNQLVQTFWMSKVGAPYNFDISVPTQANDAITGALVSLEVNEIKSIVPMPSGLVMLTTKGAWLVSGGTGGVASQGGPVTPSTITATPQAFIGANDVPPLLVNYDIIFVQQKGSIVRDITYNIYANIYTGNDISLLSSHLFYGHQIKEWAYAEEPFKMIWAVREDGILLSLTLVKEQDMYGWARHDTLGNFTSVASITEGSVDATYFVVERQTSLDTKGVFIERLAEREFPFGAEDAWCVDCGIKSPTYYPPALLRIRASGPDTVRLDTTAAFFNAGHIGYVVRASGGIFEITGFTSAVTVTAKVIQRPTEMIPDDPLHRPADAPSGTWTIDRPFTTVFGLDHLEGLPVSVLADGGVVNGLVVHDGSITLPQPVTKVIAGLGFQAQLQTMYLDLGQEINSVQGKRKKVGALTVRVKDSRGIKAGMRFNTVTPIKELNRATMMGLPISLITADERIIMDPLWDIPGQICLQIDDPLPATVLGVVPEIVIGDTPK